MQEITIDDLKKELEAIRLFLEQHVATKHDIAMLYAQLTHHTDKDVVRLENQLKNNMGDVEDEMVSEMGKTIHWELEELKKGLRGIEQGSTRTDVVETDQEILELKTRLEYVETQVKKLRNATS